MDMDSNTNASANVGSGQTHGQHRRMSSFSQQQQQQHQTNTVEPLRLTTTFNPAPSTNAEMRPTINTMMEPSSATSEHPVSTPFSARPYHLGLDTSSQSPSGGSGGGGGGGTTNSNLQLPNPASPRSMFNFERWGSPGEHGSLASFVMDSGAGGMQVPRLPTSSARSDTSNALHPPPPGSSGYWNDYTNDASMMGSSLYSLPLMSDPAVGAGGGNSFFSEPDYSIFSG